MDKISKYIFYPIVIIAIIGVFIGYYSVTANGSSQLFNKKVIEDRAYLSDNQEKYADCQYTIEVGDFSFSAVANKYFNKGVSASLLESIETKFENIYKEECSSVIKGYRDRYSMYVEHKKEAAEAELSQLDKWFGKKAEIIGDPSPIFSLYQRYDPKSLQYPTNPGAKMLYTQADYEEFVIKNL